MMKC